MTTCLLSTIDWNSPHNQQQSNDAKLHYMRELAGVSPVGPPPSPQDPDPDFKKMFKDFSDWISKFI